MRHLLPLMIALAATAASATSASAGRPTARLSAAAGQNAIRDSRDLLDRARTEKVAGRPWRMLAIRARAKARIAVAKPVPMDHDVVTRDVVPLLMESIDLTSEAGTLLND